MPAKSRNILSEATLIPVSLLVSVAGVIFWVGSLAARVDAAEKDLAQATANERAMYAELAQLHANVAAIDAKVTTILDIMEKDRARRNR